MENDEQKAAIDALAIRLMCMRFPEINALSKKDADDIARVAFNFLSLKMAGEK